MRTTSTIDQQEVLINLQRGDYAAFQQIYRSYSKKIAGNIYRLVKSQELAEDLLQDLFMRVWENRKQIDLTKSFDAYLAFIARNLVNDYFRNVAKNQRLADQLWDSLTEHYNPFDEQSAAAADQELLRVINALPEQRRKVFLLCKLEKFSYAEVSRLLNISEATVNDHITKANRFLKDNYNRAIPYALLILCQKLFN